MVERGYRQLIAEANAVVETLSVEEAMSLVGDPDVVFVDVREVVEVQKSGMIPSAVHAPRGSLEFIADPDSGNHKAPLSSGKRLVLYCASGGRSALAGKTLCDMGIPNVCHVAGGFSKWCEAGGPVENA